MSFLRNDFTTQVQPFVLLRVDFQDAVLITEHPVERGADVSDHAQVRPRRFVAECLVPETAFPGQPSSVPEALAWYDRALGQPLTLSIDNEGVFADVFLETGTHARTQIRERQFTLRLKQIRRPVALSTVIEVDRTSNVGAATRQSAGQQATQDAEVPSSILSRTTTAFGELLEAVGF